MPPSIYDTPYDELPNPRQVWVGEPSSHEEGLGEISLLTPELVARAAAEEIKTGQRVTMNWDLTKLEYSAVGRHKTQHHIVPLRLGIAFDDVYMMNPRLCSISQVQGRDVVIDWVDTVCREWHTMGWPASRLSVRPC